MKVIHSKNVIFDETSMPGIQKETEIDEEPNVDYPSTPNPPESVHQ